MAEFVIVIISPLVDFFLPGISELLSLSVELDTVSGCFARQSCAVRSLNSATVWILDQSATLEIAAVNRFPFVRVLSSLLFEVLNSLLIEVLTVWKDSARSIAFKIAVPFLAIADTVFCICESQLFWVVRCFQLTVLLTAIRKELPDMAFTCTSASHNNLLCNAGAAVDRLVFDGVGPHQHTL
nr:hypothetical protein HmN_000624800 [Hymenolepis microstoma]